MRNIFFYGLFMDRSLLTEKGLHPEMIGPAVLSGYRIHIGERATLVRSTAGRAHGIVMALSDAEASVLYSEPSVRDYVAEQVRVEVVATGHVVDADCYNLPGESGLGGANAAYATRLSRLVAEWGFGSAYVEEIAAFAEPS